MTHLTQSTQPIKVMHIIARLNIGGAAVYVIQLNAHLETLGYSSQLVCGQVGKGEGDMRYLADESNVPLTLIPTLGREISFVGDVKTIYQLWKLIRREKPQIVHTHTAKAGLVGRIAAWLAGVPVIVHTFHGHVFAGYFGTFKTRIFITLEKFCALLSTRIITLSAALKHELAYVYHIAPEDKIDVIELGFDLSPLAALQKGQGTFRQQSGIPQDVPLIGIVGRLVPIKNHALFLNAARLVKDQLPDVHFAIVGDGECRADLEAQTKALRLDDCVHFSGWIKDPLPVYSDLDVLALCSKNEGLPVSLIEAMSAGVPVVSTAVGGAPDLLEHGQLGALVPPDDPDALAAAILHCVTNPGVSATVTAARTAALDRYSIENSAALTDQLYRSLLPKK